MDIKKFIDIVSESSSGGTSAGSVAEVSKPLGSVQVRLETNDSTAPQVIEYGNWENSALTTSSKLKKERKKAAKVVKSIYGEEVVSEEANPKQQAAIAIAKKKEVAEGKFTVNAKTGAKLDPRTGAELPAKEKPLTMKDMFSQPKSTAPKLTLDAVWRKVEDVVGQIFPDGDPIDYLAPWLEKHGIRDFKIGEILERAAKKNGYEDLYDYYDSMKDQYARDNVAEGYNEETQDTEETSVINMFEKLVKQGRDPIDMIAHKFGWGSYELDQLAKNLGFSNSAGWANAVRQGKGVNEVVAEGSDVEYIVVIRDEEGKRSIRVSALTPTDAKEKAEAQGYKVLKVKDPREANYFREQGVAEGSEQVYKVVAIDKGSLYDPMTIEVNKPKTLNIQANSTQDVFDRLSGNNWHILSINGVEVINGKRLKQDVAEGYGDLDRLKAEFEATINRILDRAKAEGRGLDQLTDREKKAIAILKGENQGVTENNDQKYSVTIDAIDHGVLGAITVSASSPDEAKRKVISGVKKSWAKRGDELMVRSISVKPIQGVAEGFSTDTTNPTTWNGHKIIANRKTPNGSFLILQNKNDGRYEIHKHNPDVGGGLEFKSVHKTPEEMQVAFKKLTGVDEQQGVAEGTTQKYEMMLRNGHVKKFVAKDDADAKRIAKGNGAKSVIKLKGNVPGAKILEQDVEEGLLGTALDKVKNVGKKVLDVVAPDDEALLMQLQQSMGIPVTGQHGKRSMAEPADSKLDEADLIINPASISRKPIGLIKKVDHTDHEVEMAKSDLYQASKNALAIFQMIKDVPEEVGIEGWVQEKIIKANDYLNTIREYLEGKQLESMDGVAPSTKQVCEDDVEEGKTGPGLWANIHAKRKRIKSGSGERMRKPGSKGAPKASDFRAARSDKK